MYLLLKSLILPPASIILAAVVLWLLLRRSFRLREAVLAVALLAVYALSLPTVSTPLLASLETYPPLADPAGAAPDAEAIVVLGGGVDYKAPEFGGVTVNDLTLQRIRYAARLQRKTGLPILVSSGPVWRRPDLTHAEIMARSLREDFGAGIVWLEDRSTSTWENACDSARLLASEGIDRAFLVTHAWHMRRAAYAFSRTDVDAVPAPTAFTAVEAIVSVSDFIPDAKSLLRTYYAVHEYVGLVWYRLRYDACAPAADEAAGSGRPNAADEQAAAALGGPVPLA
jgi:uncharacterized SAM-binding protein YcdF (DUF218 family)